MSVVTKAREISAKCSHPWINSRQEKSKFVQDFPTSTSETVIFVGFQFYTYVVFCFVLPVYMCNKSVFFLFWRFFLGVLRTRQIKFAWCRSPNKRNYVFVGDELKSYDNSIFQLFCKDAVNFSSTCDMDWKCILFMHLCPFCNNICKRASDWVVISLLKKSYTQRCCWLLLELFSENENINYINPPLMCVSLYFGLLEWWCLWPSLFWQF